MAFAKSDVADHHAVAAQHVMHMGDGGGSQHHAHRQQQQQQPSTPSTPEAVPSCYGVGCFIVLDSCPPASPAVGDRAVATLSPAIAAVMVPAVLEPAVPPPRTQA